MPLARVFVAQKTGGRLSCYASDSVFPPRHTHSRPLQASALCLLFVCTLDNAVSAYRKTTEGPQKDHRKQTKCRHRANDSAQNGTACLSCYASDPVFPPQHTHSRPLQASALCRPFVGAHGFIKSADKRPTKCRQQPGCCHHSVVCTLSALCLQQPADKGRQIAGMERTTWPKLAPPAYPAMPLCPPKRAGYTTGT